MLHEVIYPMIYWPIGIAVGELVILRDRETHVTASSSVGVETPEAMPVRKIQMTEHAQTKPSYARPASDASERAASISTGAALGKTPGPVPLDQPTKDLRRQRSASALYQKAADLMSSPAITARTTEPVFSVARLMLESGISGVPVLDAGGRPVGMVSDGDLLGRRGEGRLSPWLEMLAKRSPPPESALERPVGEVMSAPLITISLNASVRDIAETFQAHRIKRLPVLDGEGLVGVVSRADLLCLIESLPAARPVRPEEGAGLLGFLESLIGGASLRGAVAAPDSASASAYRRTGRGAKRALREGVS